MPYHTKFGSGKDVKHPIPWAIVYTPNATGKLQKYSPRAPCTLVMSDHYGYVGGAV